jgi:WD40 repeat protein
MDYQVEVRNMVTGQNMPAFTAALNEEVQEMILLPGQQWVVTADNMAPVLKVWKFTTQEKLYSVSGHNLVINRIRISPDERRIASSTIGQEAIKIWDTDGWHEVAGIEGRFGFVFAGLEFLPDGNTIAIAETNLETQAGEVRLFRAPRWEEITAAEKKEEAANTGPEFRPHLHFQ